MALESSLTWIVQIMREQSIPFVITGGLAAHIYGSDRPINDIDIDIPTDDLPRLLPFVSRFVKFGPGHFRNDAWDLTILTLDHYGQEIDVSGADSIRIYDPRNSQWVEQKTNLSAYQDMPLFGMTLPVTSPQSLLYKELLAAWGRPHQIQDVAAIHRYLKRG